MLLSRSQVCSPAVQQSQSADPQVVVKEHTAFTAGHHVRRTDSSCGKDSNSLLAWGQGFWLWGKTGWGESHGTHGQLVDLLLIGCVEITGWCFENLRQPSCSSQSEVYMLVVSRVTILPLSRGLSSCRTTQRCASHYYLYSFRRNQGSCDSWPN